MDSPLLTGYRLTSYPKILDFRNGVMGCLGAVASLSITCAHVIVCEAHDHAITKG